MSLDTLLDFGTLDNLGNVFYLMVIVLIVIAFWRAHVSNTSSIDLGDMFLEGGKIGGSKMRLNAAFILASSLLVYETMHGHLTEWLFGGYLAAFVFDRMQARKEPPKKVEEVSDEAK
jgi:hypothetical protein